MKPVIVIRYSLFDIQHFYILQQHGHSQTNDAEFCLDFSASRSWYCACRLTVMTYLILT